MSFGLILLATANAHAEELLGKVVGVSDGDTVTVIDSNTKQHKIRLNGIDAPESSQDFGQASKRNLSALVFGKDVTVRWSKRDRYGRIIGTVLRNDEDVNLAQLRAGFAWYFRQYERDVPSQMRATYAAAEAEARQAHRGLWAQPNPTPPWEFRHPKQAQLLPELEEFSPGKIIGNRNSNVYHLPNCPDYHKVSERNRIYFSSVIEAERAGFRKARNCP